MRRSSLVTAVLVLLALLPLAAQAQERGSVTGTVTAADTRQAVQGAQVTIPALNLSGITDERGRFLLMNVRTGTHTLQVNFIGYRQASRQLNVTAGTNTVNIELEMDPLLLDELVVVGYGEERRRNVAGAVSSLRAETVKETSVASVTEALQGRMPGIQVSQNSGAPGSGITVRIRGSSSISGGN